MLPGHSAEYDGPSTDLLADLDERPASNVRTSWFAHVLLRICAYTLTGVYTYTRVRARGPIEDRYRLADGARRKASNRIRQSGRHI